MMQKTDQKSSQKMIKRVSIILLGVTAGTIALFYYIWRQFTNLPAWYTQPPARSEQVTSWQNQQTLEQTIEQLENKVNSQILALEKSTPSQPAQENSPFDTRPIVGNRETQPLQDNEIEIPLNETELNALVLSNLTQEKTLSPFLPSIKGVNTTIQNGKLETGIVVNLEEIPTEQLASSQKATLDQVKHSFPFLNQKEVYLAIEGQPQLVNHQLQFDPNTQVKFGNLTMTLADIAKTLKIPESQLEKALPVNLQLGNLEIHQIELKDNQALLRGFIQEVYQGN
jgi:hypothetical protein